MSNLAQRTSAAPVIQISLESTSYLTRGPCVTCGGHTGKDRVLPMWREEVGTRHGMCDRCVVASPEEIRCRLIKHAERLEHNAKALRRLAEAEWQLPSIEEIAEARINHQAELIQYEEWAGRFDPELHNFDRDDAFKSYVEHLNKLRASEYESLSDGDSI